MMSKCECGCGTEVKKEGHRFVNGHNQRGNSPWNKGKHYYISEEGRRNMEGRIPWNFRGGRSQYFHEKARHLFGTLVCEKCGLSLEEYCSTHKVKKFDMHCVTKDFTIIEQWNWNCVCHMCHESIHNEMRRKSDT